MAEVFLAVGGNIDGANVFVYGIRLLKRPDLRRITTELEREGVQAFCDSYHELLDCIESKLRAVAPEEVARHRG